MWEFSKPNMCCSPRVLLLCMVGVVAVCASGNSTTFEYIVVGAGISGAAAASTLKKAGKSSVVVLEANDRVGGRLYSRQVDGYTVNLGASWIHGVRGNPLVSLANRAGVALSSGKSDYEDTKTFYGDGQPVPPSAEARYDATWEKFETYLENRQDEADDDDADDPGLGSVVSAFVRKEKLVGLNRDAFFFNVKINIEDEYAADYSQMSLWFDEDKELPGGDRLVLGPYDGLVKYLLEGIDVRLGSPVNKIDYSRSSVISVTTGSRTYTATKAVIVTVPLGVLKAGSISFVPSLPRRNRNAIAALGMGLLNKCVMIFDRIWWDQNEWIQQISSTFQATFDLAPVNGQPILYGFNSAKNAKDVESWSDTKTCETMMDALRRMYPTKAETYRSCVVTRWGKDALSKGSYSYTTPRMEYEPAHVGVGAPVDGGRVSFAGEATSVSWPATAHGAYSSGVSAANRLVR